MTPLLAALANAFTASSTDVFAVSELASSMRAVRAAATRVRAVVRWGLLTIVLCSRTLLLFLLGIPSQPKLFHQNSTPPEAVLQMTSLLEALSYDSEDTSHVFKP